MRDRLLQLLERRLRVEAGERAQLGRAARSAAPGRRRRRACRGRSPGSGRSRRRGSAAAAPGCRRRRRSAWTWRRGSARRARRSAIGESPAISSLTLSTSGISAVRDLRVGAARRARCGSAAPRAAPAPAAAPGRRDRGRGPPARRARAAARTRVPPAGSGAARGTYAGRPPASVCTPIAVNVSTITRVAACSSSRLLGTDSAAQQERVAGHARPAVVDRLAGDPDTGRKGEDGGSLCTHLPGHRPGAPGLAPTVLDRGRRTTTGQDGGRPRGANPARRLGS